MTQSGKIVAYSSTALSAAAMLGISALLIAAPWIGMRPAAQPTELAASEARAAQSEQAKSPAEAPGTPLAEVRALAAAVSGPSPLPQATPSGIDPAAQSVETVAPPPPDWTPVEVGAALMECVSLLAPDQRPGRAARARSL